MKNKASVLILFFFHLAFYPQQYNVIKDYYKEDFTVRAFAYSKEHYFARLSYNDQTIYTTNMLHPNKSVSIFSNENSGVKTLDFSNDENYLITGTNSGTLEVWDINKRILFKKINLHNKAVNKVKVLSGASTFISAGNDGQIFLIDFIKQNQHELIGFHEGIVRDFDVSEDENFMISIGGDKLILWDLIEGKKIKTIELIDAKPTSVKFISKSNTILVGDTEGKLLWLDNKLSIKKTFQAHKNIITSICDISENSFVTGSFDGSIKKINIQNNAISEIYNGKSYIIHIAIMNSKLVFSNRNGELITLKVRP